jgi:hypothetical protein
MRGYRGGGRSQGHGDGRWPKGRLVAAGGRKIAEDGVVPRDVEPEEDRTEEDDAPGAEGTTRRAGAAALLKGAGSEAERGEEMERSSKFREATGMGMESDLSRP